MTLQIPVSNAALNFLSGGGEMGRLIREFDWAGHPLGNPGAWPQSLKTAVSLILNSKHPMWIGWGPEISFLYNDAYLHVLGLAKHPWALGRPASEVWAEIWDVCGPLAERVFSEGQATFLDDVRLFMNRGDFLEETYYSFSYSPIPDESGNVGGLFCPSNDVTAKVLSARRLRTLSELSANALVEKTTNAACAAVGATLARNPDDIPFALLYLLDADGVHAELKEMVGLNARVLTSQSVPIYATQKGESWPLADVFLTGQPHRVPVAVFDSLPRGPAGQPVSEAVILPAVSRADHRPLGVLIAGLNPTRKSDADYQTFLELVASHVGTAIQNARAVEEEKKRADLLAELDRAKTTFFSNVSHEFRTPLTLMLGPLEETLKDADRLPPEDRERLEIAHRNSLRLLRLVNSLLDFSRIEAGRTKAFYVPVDLAALTADLASNFRSAMQAAGLELVVECPPLPATVYVDREMWEKIVLNLLSNAFKFTFAGRVTVKLETTDNRAILTIADTGTGIPEAELPHIFERFHRVEGAKGRTYEGTGIGLALIQELVKLHGGTVEVQSRMGEGTAFRVSLLFGTAHLPQDHIGDRVLERAETPVQAEAFTGEAMTWLARDRLVHPSDDFRRSQPDTQSDLRARVLLADDNADMREHVKHSLEGEYHVIAVSDGSTALKAARENKPDVILSDVMMPGLDGFGLLRELRSDADLREVPVILLSARAGEEARTEGISAGADDYLTKPFNTRELVARIKTTLNLQRVRPEARAEVERVSMRLQSALRAARMIAWDWDLESGQVVCSDNALELLGSPANVPVERMWASIHPDDEAPLRQLIAEAIEKRGDYTTQLRYIRPDTGVLQWLEVHGSVIRDRAGGAAKLGGVLIDITARRKGAQERQARAAQFETLLNQAPLGVYLVDAEFRIRQVNPTARLVFGDIPDLIGRDFAEVMHMLWPQKYADEVVGRFRHTLESGEPYFAPEHIEQRFDRGVKEYYEWHVGRIPLPDGRSGVVCYFRDISAQVLAREEIAFSEQRFREIAEVGPQFIWISGPDGAPEYVNQRWTDYSGLDLAATSNPERLAAAVHEDDKAELITRWQKSVASGEPYHLEARFRRQDGVFRWYVVRGLPIRDEAGAIVRWVGASTDIHEQKQVQEELRRVNADLEQFAYSASHDLQEPLRSVKIYSELLNMRYRQNLDGQALEFLDYLRTGASRMETLVRDLLTYTEATRLDKPPEPTDANDALHTALANLAGAISESGAQIEITPLPSLPIHGTHLQLLFQNLVSNAIKYRRLGTPPVLNITAKREKSQWLFAVSDNGIGIESEYKERIFGLFKRLHTGDEYSGTGIGLAVCQRIVDRYHGRIWVESVPGEGSTFYFRLPV